MASVSRSCTLVALLLTPCLLYAEDAKPVNVLFIAIDDLKPVLGCYGDQTVHSPRIDELAGRGTVFLNSQCQQAVCGPSRASLLTGLRPDTTRVWDLKTRLRDKLPDVVTLPQHFKQNGYEVVGLGKIFDPRSVDGQNDMDRVSWSRPHLWPKAPSEDSFGYRNPETVAIFKEGVPRAKAAGVEGWHKIQEFLGHRPATDKAKVSDDAYDDGVFATKGVDLIQELARGEKPFFLAVGFKKPHLPFCAPAKYWDLYDRNQFEAAEVTSLPEGAPKYHYQDSWELRSGYTDIPPGILPDEMQRKLIHGYYACTSYVDAQVGKLLDALKESGAQENTVVVLWGDHGWHLGDHGMWCKHTNYEQAARAPLVITTPNQKARGAKSTSPVEFLDIYPTLCDLAGLKPPTELHGHSLRALLDDPSRSVRAAAVSQYPRGHGAEMKMGYTFRTERYRLIEWRPFDPTAPHDAATAEVADREIYDYEVDPLERRNLIDDPDYAHVAAEMQAHSEAYWAAHEPASAH